MLDGLNRKRRISLQHIDTDWWMVIAFDMLSVICAAMPTRGTVHVIGRNDF